MTTQTLLHLLYFLPALIVYGVWTWIFISRVKLSVTNPKAPVTFLDMVAFIYLCLHPLAFIGFAVLSLIEGIKYFSN